MPDGAHTHGHGPAAGPGIGLVVVILVALAFAGPVAAAAAAVIHVLAVVVAVAAGLALTAGAVLVAWRIRAGRRGPRALPARPVIMRAAGEPAATRPAEIHLHLHGVDPADVPAIVQAARHAPSPRPWAAAVAPAERLDGPR